MRTRSLRAALAALLLAAGACTTDHLADAASLTNGDPRRGRAEIRDWGCGTCHTIGGVPGAQGKVGPELNGLAERAYIAGVMPNSPDNLIRWIENPKKIDAKTAMPNLDVPDGIARDIAAYIYTLR